MEQSNSLEVRIKLILDNIIETYDQSIQNSLELNQSLLPPIDPEYGSTYSDLIYTSIKPEDSFKSTLSSSNLQKLKRTRTFSTEQIETSRKLFRNALPSNDSSMNNGVGNNDSSRSINSSSSSIQHQPNHSETIRQPIQISPLPRKK